MDSEKEEMNQTDIAALHHFYSKHISNLPDDQALTELFAQVKLDKTLHLCLLCQPSCSKLYSVLLLSLKQILKSSVLIHEYYINLKQ